VRKKINFSAITPWNALVRSALVCSIFAVVVFGLAYRRIEPLPLNEAPLHFNSTYAYDYMRHLAKNYPNRVTWGPNRKAAGAWLKSELIKLGYTPKSLYFSEVIAGKQYTDLENIYVEKQGTTHPNEIVVAMAHYDVVDTTSEGAMDDASGVGVVLELARVFAHEKSDRTLIFMLTDSEEYGAFWGATAFAQSFEKADQIVAAANFDFVAPEKQSKILTLCDGLKSGFTPLWLREIALDSLRSLGSTEVLDLDGIVEFIERAMQIPPADHGAFLAAGIPAFNWVGQTDHFTYVMAHYHHTLYDVAEAMQEKSFDSFGKGAERVIRSINSLPRIPTPTRDSSYWKVSPHYYLPGWAVTLLHILAFIPFLSYGSIKFGRTFRTTPKSRVWEVVQNEIKLMAVLLGSLIAGYAIMLLLPALRVITLYENFPATQKSLLLYSPNFFAMIAVLAGIAAVYLLFTKTFIRPNDSEGYVEIRHALHAGFLTLIILLALVKNSYLAVLLLLPPAYLWTAIRRRRRPEDRLLNGLLLLGGAITFLATAMLLTTIFNVGVVYWYIFLAAAYGLISAYSVVLFFMALTVMIRLFRSFVL